MLGLGIGRFRRSPMAPRTIACPYCGKELAIVPEAVSIPCSKCSRRVELEDLEVVEKISRDLMTGASVLVRVGAMVKGNIHAAEITILGSVQGNLKASRLIHLAATARVNGAIEAPRLEMEEGALVVGRLTITNKARKVRGKR